MVASVLVRPGAGRACAAAQSGPRPRCGDVAVSRRPAHLTEREEQILACSRRSITERGEGLSMTEIGAAVGLRSKGTVAYHLRNLEERGVLVRDGFGWRSCRLAR
ncbi:LexA family protein [Streptomyces sp. NPDC006285]|uniref:LexA family protein n=1 Tax=Streptomyces sp. NPDC006285 TaxID=3364742 RepID=UPI0036C797E0